MYLRAVRDPGDLRSISVVLSLRTFQYFYIRYLWDHLLNWERWTISKLVALCSEWVTISENFGWSRRVFSVVMLLTSKSGFLFRIACLSLLKTDVTVAVDSSPRFKKAEVSTDSGVEALEGLQDLGLSLVLSSPLRNLKAHLLTEEIVMVSSWLHHGACHGFLLKKLHRV